MVRPAGRHLNTSPQRVDMFLCLFFGHAPFRLALSLNNLARTLSILASSSATRSAFDCMSRPYLSNPLRVIPLYLPLGRRYQFTNIRRTFPLSFPRSSLDECSQILRMLPMRLVFFGRFGSFTSHVSPGLGLRSITQSLDVEPVIGFEPMTANLQNSCSTTELNRRLWKVLIPPLDTSAKTSFGKKPSRATGVKLLCVLILACSNIPTSISFEKENR